MCVCDRSSAASHVYETPPVSGYESASGLGLANANYQILPDAGSQPAGSEYSTLASPRPSNVSASPSIYSTLATRLGKEADTQGLIRMTCSAALPAPCIWPALFTCPPNSFCRATACIVYLLCPELFCLLLCITFPVLTAQVQRLPTLPAAGTWWWRSLN